MNRLVYIFISAILVMSCTHTQSEYSSYANTDKDGWRYGDTLYFSIAHKAFPPDSDTIKTGALSIVVRNTNKYEYSNLWLELQYTDADTVVTDTVNVQLADPYGVWLGKGMGITFQQEQLIKNHATINTAAAVRVSHIMRVDTLNDIEQVGVIFIPD